LLRSGRQVGATRSLRRRATTWQGDRHVLHLVETIFAAALEHLLGCETDTGVGLEHVLGDDTRTAGGDLLLLLELHIAIVSIRLCVVVK
jgi:hypothetical protein